MEPIVTAAVPAPPVPLAGSELEHWMLDPAIDFLNHGCFGARLRSVSAAQQRLREAYEARPIFTLDRHRDEAIDAAKETVGGFLGMRPDDFGFVTNATGGVNAVLRSLAFEPGDEILTTSHVYPAVRQTMQALAERAGARTVEAPIPLPVASADAVTDAVLDAVTDRTRLLVIDHVTSPTALRFPVETIVARCRERGVETLLDGAHVPGMFDLDVASIGAAYYTGNLHKWIGAPSGAAFLWARPDRQAGLHPPVISHFRGEGMRNEFHWQGTRDISPWLCAPVAIDAMAGFGWDSLRSHNRALAAWAHAHLTARWNVASISPADGSMLGSMATVRVPPSVARRFPDDRGLHDHLYDEHRLEVASFMVRDEPMLRVSAQVYNRPEQYERLGNAVAGLM